MPVNRRADDIAILKAAIEEAMSKWQKSTATLSDIRVLDVLSNKDIGPVHMNRGSKVKSRSLYF
ncbi:MAG: hypothetical protein ACUVTR_05145 [Dehalococcoidia bacterium]